MKINFFPRVAFGNGTEADQIFDPRRDEYGKQQSTYKEGTENGCYNTNGQSYPEPFKWASS